MSSSQYIRLTEAAISAVRASHLPLYSCKYSKKTYTQHQLLVLLLLKEQLGQDYRGFTDLVEVMDSIRHLLHLETIPHFTTLHKFLQRLSSLWLTRIQKRLVASLYPWGAVIPITAIDASGFTSAYASSYYSLRTGKTHRRFLKVSLAVDTTTQVILAATMTQHPIADVRMARSLLKESHRTRQAACYVLDKGYDAESIHRQIREEIHAISLIPVRTRKRKRIHGRYRRELASTFDEKTYHRRNLVETVFSVLKRTLGESLRSRKYRLQAKEIKIKIILYNLKRTLASHSIQILVIISTERLPPGLIKYYQPMQRSTGRDGIPEPDAGAIRIEAQGRGRHIRLRESAAGAGMPGTQAIHEPPPDPLHSVAGEMRGHAPPAAPPALCGRKGFLWNHLEGILAQTIQKFPGPAWQNYLWSARIRADANLQRVRGRSAPGFVRHGCTAGRERTDPCPRAGRRTVHGE